MFDIAKNLILRLRQAGFTAYFAGGCVRDHVLGTAPKDVDIATNARPVEVRRLFPNTRAVGAHFGVVIVAEQGHAFEVATFRSDGAYLDGRRPESVSFSSPEEDAQRRDFTVNGMFYDPIEGRVIDFVGGQQDLKAGVIRAIGDAASRFDEDKLRLMRAVRFAARFGFEIEEATWAAIQKKAGEIHQVSVERIREELVHTLLLPRRLMGFDLLESSGLLRQILPELEAMKGCEQPPQFHPEGDVFVHTRIMLGLLPEMVSVPLVFAVLLHDVGKPKTQTVDSIDGRIRFHGHDRVGANMAERIMHRLRFSNDHIAKTVEAVRNHMVFKDVKNMRPARLRRFMARPGFDDELELHRVDCLSCHGLLDNWEYVREKVEEFARAPLIPAPLITGRDLIALGWNPSPRFKQVLDAAQTAQLEGEIESREEALAWVQKECSAGHFSS